MVSVFISPFYANANKHNNAANVSNPAQDT